ncbi:nucleotidyltransferase domain-containing protein [bacterium]|nr:nucleotidyltransferase domain-containing protein [bacterium]
MNTGLLGRKEQFQALLRKNNVVLAYLFGSGVRNSVGSLSDLDLAVCFFAKVPREEYFRRELELGGAIDKFFEFDKTDIINLATCKSPLLKYEAVFRGEAVLIRDEFYKYTVESHIMKEYEDTKYLRNIQFSLMRKRLSEGRFGHSPLSSQYTRKYVSCE